MFYHKTVLLLFLKVRNYTKTNLYSDRSPNIVVFDVHDLSLWYFPTISKITITLGGCFMIRYVGARLNLRGFAAQVSILKL